MIAARARTFGIMDSVSIPTILKVEERYFEATGDESDRPPEFLYRMVEKDQHGVRTGKGFYDHPNPAYERADWLSGKN